MSGPLAAALGAVLVLGACQAQATPTAHPVGGATVQTGAVVTVASVYDGDTFTDTAGAKYRVLVIDSCEMGTPGGLRARTEARALLLGKTVTVTAEPGHEREPDRNGRRGRNLVYVTLGDRDDFGERMVMADHTAVYRGRHDAHPDRVAIARLFDGTPDRDCTR